MAPPGGGQTHWGIADVIRFNVVTLETGVQEKEKNIKAEALEYSCIYEQGAGLVPNRLAHGYVIAFGDVVVFVQHTSVNAITSEDARSIALSLIRRPP
jgi:hypothetical protein